MTATIEILFVAAFEAKKKEPFDAKAKPDEKTKYARGGRGFWHLVAPSHVRYRGKADIATKGCHVRF